MILFIKNHIIWFPSVQHCNWFGFRISLSLSREGAIFRDEIENYFSCSRLARRDRDYHMTILVFRDENEIPFCYSHVSRRDRDFRKSFLVVEREKMKLTLVQNSRDREFSLTSAWSPDNRFGSSTTVKPTATGTAGTASPALIPTPTLLCLWVPSVVSQSMGMERWFMRSFMSRSPGSAAP